MVLVCGLNHKTAPLSVREACVFQPTTLQAPLRELVASGAYQEAAIVSTCNRTEIYCRGNEPDHLLSWLQAYHPTSLTPYLYTYQQDDAVRHLLRVASGLDSQILGEPQILGQLKQAYQLAQHAGTLGASLHRLFQYVFAVTKQVRTGTGIGQHPISVAYAAVQLLKQQQTMPRVLLVGAGDTIELVTRYLQNLSVTDVLIANRDVIKATRLAKRINGQATCLGAIPYHLSQVDVVISAAQTQAPLITADMITNVAQHAAKPLLLIDLAVPRNIEAACGELSHTQLYTIDDLTDTVTHNMTQRQSAAKQADALIEFHVNAFMAILRRLDAVSVIRAYRHNTQAICDDLLKRAQKQLIAGQDPNGVLTEFSQRLRNKLTHAPTVWISELGEQGDLETLDSMQQCFDLDES